MRIATVTIGLLLICQNALAQGFFIEQFGSDTHNDVSQTTANWDTQSETLTLFPYQYPVVSTTPTDWTWFEAVSGDWLYAGIGGDLQVFDISRVEEPEAVGRYKLPALARCIAFQGRDVLVSSWGKLLRIDVEDPSNPVMRDVINLPGSATDIEMRGDVAFLVCRDIGVVVADLADWSSPRLQVLGVHASDIELDGDLLYLVDSRAGGLMVFDASDPREIHLIGQLLTDTSASHFSSLVVDRDTAFIEVGSWDVLVVDVEDPASPRTLGRVETRGNLQGFASSGSKLYCSDGYGGMTVVDSSDRTAPKVIYNHPSASGTQQVLLLGNMAVMAQGHAGIDIIEVAEDAPPTILGRDGQFSDPTAVVLHGDIALVSDRSGGLALLDAGDAAYPKHIASLLIPGSPRAVATYGAQTLIAAGSAGTVIVDTSNPAAPQHLETIPAVGSSVAVGLFGRSPIVAEDGGMLVMYESISNPAEVGRVVLEGQSPVEVLALESFVIVSSKDYGIEVLDLRSEGGPSVVERFGVSGGVSASASNGSKVYVAERSGGIRTLELEWSGTITERGFDSTEGLITDLVLSGSRLYASETGVGVTVYDLSDPASLKRIGHAAVSGGVTCLAMRGEHVYAAGPKCGLQSVRVRQAEFDLELDQAQSTVVARAVAPIHRVALDADYSGTVEWSVSADGGASWQRIESSREWLILDVPGRELKWRANLKWNEGPAEVRSLELRYSEFEGDPFAATVSPNTLNLSSGGGQVLIKLSPVAEVALDEIDRGSVVLMNSIAPVEGSVKVSGNTLRAHFARADLANCLEPGANVPLVVSGSLRDGRSFVAVDTIRVLGDASSDELARSRITGPALEMVGEVGLRLSASPNPFNPQTTLHYDLSVGGRAELIIYDLAGRRVKTLVSGYIDAGQHEAEWDGRDEQGRRVASGVYLYRLVAGDFVETKRMVLLK